jgi:hypothetical protein
MTHLTTLYELRTELQACCLSSGPIREIYPWADCWTLNGSLASAFVRQLTNPA